MMEIAKDLSKSSLTKLSHLQRLCQPLLLVSDSFLPLHIALVIAIDNPILIFLQLIQKLKNVVLTIVSRVFVVDGQLLRFLFDGGDLGGGYIAEMNQLGKCF